MPFTYPGFAVWAELYLFNAYLKNLESSVTSIGENFITSEFSSLAQVDDHYRVQIQSIAEIELPNMLKLPYIVSLYSFYESSVDQLIGFLTKLNNHAIKLSDLGGHNSNTAKYNKYIKHILKLDFQFSESFMNALSKITKIRNFIVHANGNIEYLSSEKVKEIHLVLKEDCRLSLIENKLNVNFEYLLGITEIINGEVERFLLYIEDNVP
ncbi:MAG: hypothetical protein V4732_12240 [Pseudomonadota bacterium]